MSWLYGFGEMFGDSKLPLISCVGDTQFVVDGEATATVPVVEAEVFQKARGDTRAGENEEHDEGDRGRDPGPHSRTCTASSTSEKFAVLPCTLAGAVGLSCTSTQTVVVWPGVSTKSVKDVGVVPVGVSVQLAACRTATTSCEASVPDGSVKLTVPGVTRQRRDARVADGQRSRVMTLRPGRSLVRSSPVIGWSPTPLMVRATLPEATSPGAITSVSFHMA